jgi:hypothetical protein
MAKCEECSEPLVEDMKSSDWLALYGLLELLHSESKISDLTHENAVNRLMRMKRFAMAAEVVIFDDLPTEEDIESAVKRLRKDWIEEDDENAV